MIQIARLIVTFVLFFPALSLAEVARDFTSSDGKVLRATLVNANDEKVILVRASDQRRFVLPIDRLSETDQEYIKRWSLANVLFVHPLGWKKLQVHAPPGIAIMSGNAATPISPDGGTELYLRVGSWVRLSSSREGISALKQFKGESDWYVSTEKSGLMRVGSEAGRPGVAAGFVFTSGADEGGAPEGFPMVSLKDAKKYIKAGSSVHCMDETYLEALIAAGAMPLAIILNTGAAPNWAQFPKNLQALRLSAGQNVDFTGIEELRDLEMFSLTTYRNAGGGAGEISKTQHLAKLTKLSSLTLRCVVPAAEFPSLGGLKALRDLNFQEQSKRAALKPDAYDFLGKLTMLEKLHLGSHWIDDKLINPAVLKNCSKLTSYRISQDTYSDKGAFLRALPKLTKATFASGRVSPEIVNPLMEEGHFKHLRSLFATGAYTLKNLPQLQTLSLEGSLDVTALAKSDPLPKLRRLMLGGYTADRLDQLSELPLAKGVETISLLRWSGKFPTELLAKFPALSNLEVNYLMNNGADTLDLAALPGLRSLSIGSSTSFESVTGLGNLRSLKLGGGGCSVKQLGDESGCANLEDLEILGLADLKTLEGLGKCPKIRRLDVRHCKDLKSTGGLERSSSLSSAHVSNSGTVPDYDLEKK